MFFLARGLYASLLHFHFTIGSGTKDSDSSLPTRSWVISLSSICSRFSNEQFSMHKPVSGSSGRATVNPSEEHDPVAAQLLMGISEGGGYA